MMLRWSLGQPAAADAVEAAVDAVLDDGVRTGDLVSGSVGGTSYTVVGTQEMARRIGERRIAIARPVSA
jgi:3-isopropylmalate dehydrogenase